MEVEVFTRSTEDEKCGWWIGILKMMNAECCAVMYTGLGTYTEVVTLDRLRAKNLNPPFTPTTIHKFTIPVPEELRAE